MSGFATSLAANVYPAEFAQISQNMLNQMSQAAQSAAQSRFQSLRSKRRTSVDAEEMAANPDRDADGHAWGPPMRPKRENPPERHRLEELAGEGSIFDQRA
ncbi:MAG: hypothetical protein KDB07_11240 [Planctomycetes bacterium]|nr:hypothetical protein [Planctomycetota bacterium]